MTPSQVHAADLTPVLITRHFNPAWFASVMGTAVVPLALSFTGADWLPWVARIMIQAALEREESRGVHLRTDFPETDEGRWCRHQRFCRSRDE